MSGIAVRLDGLRDLLRGMERLPDGLEQRCAPLLRASAERTASRVRAAIPVGGSGTLAKRVTVVERDALVHQVESRAPHAWLYEYGSGDRRTRSGANRGRMPARKLLGAVASDERRKLNADLVQAFEDVLRQADRP